mmetsp:Transcript_21027/g.62578  ORF Transcript_21027/g.62578 Transcript_21027/m.62578 type:complete len:278 (-) Transcript_21027:465-1298(-)
MLALAVSTLSLSLRFSPSNFLRLFFVSFSSSVALLVRRRDTSATCCDVKGDAAYPGIPIEPAISATLRSRLATFFVWPSLAFFNAPILVCRSPRERTATSLSARRSSRACCSFSSCACFSLAARVNSRSSWVRTTLSASRTVMDPRRSSTCASCSIRRVLVSVSRVSRSRILVKTDWRSSTRSTIGVNSTSIDSISAVCFSSSSRLRRNSSRSSLAAVLLSARCFTASSTRVRFLACSVIVFLITSCASLKRVASKMASNFSLSFLGSELGQSESSW